MCLLLESFELLLTCRQTKGGLISSFSRLLKSPKRCAKNYPEHYPSKEKMLRIILGTFFGDWSQSEKLSEIKPPL